MKTQKKLLDVVVVCSLVVSVWGNAYAHPPKTITAKYDYETNILEIKVSHKVKDAEKHFIEKIEVSLNRKKIIKQEMFSQTDKNKQIVQYTIVDTEAGDKLKITARCSVYGTDKKTVIIRRKELESDKPKEVEKKK